MLPMEERREHDAQPRHDRPQIRGQDQADDLRLGRLRRLGMGRNAVLRTIRSQFKKLVYEMRSTKCPRASANSATSWWVTSLTEEAGENADSVSEIELENFHHNVSHLKIANAV